MQPDVGGYAWGWWVEALANCCKIYNSVKNKCAWWMRRTESEAVRWSNWMSAVAHRLFVLGGLPCAWQPKPTSPQGFT
jgi:hypothetical protein